MTKLHRIRLSTPADIASFVPYLLGFHPRERIVVLAEHQGRLQFAVAVTLPGNLPAFDRVAAQLRHGLTQRRISSVWLVGYGSDKPVRAGIDRLTAALTGSGVSIRDAIRVDDNRLWHLSCTDPHCPLTGTAFDPQSTAAAASATLAGLVALPDRDAVTAQLQPTRGAERAAFTAATIRAVAQVDAIVDAADAPQRLRDLARHLVDDAVQRHRRGERLDDNDAALLTALMALDSLRNEAAHQVRGDDTQIAVWMDLTRRAEPRFTPGVAVLLALAALQTGNGALARDALDRALQVDPNDALAQLLSQALQLGADPDTIARLLRG